MNHIIPGQCRIWTRYHAADDPYWVTMSYAPRGYRECLRIVQAYRERYPEREYRITADSDLLRPLPTP